MPAEIQSAGTARPEPPRIAPKDEELKVRIGCEMSCPGKAPSLLSICVRSKYYKRTQPLYIRKGSLGRIPTVPALGGATSNRTQP